LNMQGEKVPETESLSRRTREHKGSHHTGEWVGCIWGRERRPKCLEGGENEIRGCSWLDHTEPESLSRKFGLWVERGRKHWELEERMA
jgi:hypothetical protein